MLDMLADGFASGSVITALMLLLAVEGVALTIVFRANGWARAALDAGCIVVPGLLLMLAVQLALTGADWRMIATTLAAAGLVHALDVSRRVRGG